MQTIEEFQKALSEFAEERDWDQFHSPKNLAMALSVEVSELLEHFQWLTNSASQRKNLDEKTMSEVENELADVFLYLVRLADKLEVDLMDVATKKIDINAKKYPISLSKGNSTKYSRRGTAD